ncbi:MULTISPECIES: hypothetical protein [Myxococcus]|uniref:hypothetical protein n=1 Tax=Myxococcus TaxID=32 RepID=UPI00129C2C1F|nr:MULTISPECIES: hypothetical protein [Myxococcus]NOK06805.1 hypothetical protein [Myxococcus xanthus]
MDGSTSARVPSPVSGLLHDPGDEALVMLANDMPARIFDLSTGALLAQVQGRAAE